MWLGYTVYPGTGMFLVTLLMNVLKYYDNPRQVRDIFTLSRLILVTEPPFSTRSFLLSTAPNSHIHSTQRI